MRPENLVETVENLCRPQVLGAGERRREIRPEVAQHLFPIDFVIGNAVKLFFEIGGEVIADVARKKAFEKGDDKAAFVFRDEPLLVDADIVAVAQDGERRSISRGPAYAEFFHPLDE